MAPVTLEVRDETTAGETLAALAIQLGGEQVTVRELISARVRQEVRVHNAKLVGARDRFVGLVQPEETERELNGERTGYRLKRPRLVDGDRQTDAAVQAFERGHVLLLVDDRQVDELDHELTLTSTSSVSFLKLVPLVAADARAVPTAQAARGARRDGAEPA